MLMLGEICRVQPSTTRCLEYQGAIPANIASRMNVCSHRTRGVYGRCLSWGLAPVAELPPAWDNSAWTTRNSNMLTSGTRIYPNGIAYSLFCFAPSSAALKNSSLVQDGFFCGFSNPDDWPAGINGNCTNSEIYDHRPQRWNGWRCAISSMLKHAIWKNLEAMKSMHMWHLIDATRWKT